MIAPGVIVAADASILVLLSVYGFHCYFVTYLRFRAGTTPPLPTLKTEPRVVVQLPIYNEAFVLPRLVNAVGTLDWPRDRLEIQILDDSTDETRTLADTLAQEWRARGLDIRVIRRTDRTGFKAGALRHALTKSDAEFVAIFDADFVPRPDFLRLTVPHLVADTKLACVQARWTHVNPEYSPLTRAQAMGIDGHFAVEQRARNAHGLLINFNGTAGVWRARAIHDAGGWSADTLAEDLDLSYRAQLAGWHFLYLDDVEAPAEIPTQIQALKRQQARWAQGSIQCLRKHAWAIVRHRQLRTLAKVEALIHLSNYLVHPLMLALSLLMLPLLFTTGVPPSLGVFVFLATFGPPLMYAAGQRALHPGSWRGRLVRLVPLTLVGIGVGVSNTRAVIAGLFRSGGEFQRTPKFRIESASDSWRGNQYALSLDWTIVGEGALTLFMGATVVVAMWLHRYAVLPWALLFFASYGTVFVLSARHHIRRVSSVREGATVVAMDAP